MELEKNLQNGLFEAGGEKTFIDKILARKDVEELREIVKKNRLSRSDMLEILYLLSSVESKLLNFSEQDRYIVLKFFVWIREVVKVAEQLFDYRESLEEKQKKGEFKITQRTERLLKNSELMIEHNVKFLVDLYLNIGRTTLSIGATGIMEILKNKYEISYPLGGGMQMNEQPKPSLWGRKGGN